MRALRTIAQRIDVVRNIASIIANAGSAWLEHDASTIGAALAFYTVFSIAPIVIIAIGIASMVVQGDALRAELLSQTQNLLGPTGANAVRELLTSADYLGKSRYATFIGVVTLLFGSSSVFVELQNALDRVWEILRRRRVRGLWGILRARFLALGL